MVLYGVLEQANQSGSQGTMTQGVKKGAGKIGVALVIVTSATDFMDQLGNCSNVFI